MAAPTEPANNPLDLHVEPDPERPGAWRVSASGRLLSRHPIREEAVDRALREVRHAAAPAEVEIDAAAEPGDEPA